VDAALAATISANRVLEMSAQRITSALMNQFR
jgi:hypothetical protein